MEILKGYMKSAQDKSAQKKREKEPDYVTKVRAEAAKKPPATASNTGLELTAEEKKELRGYKSGGLVTRGGKKKMGKAC